MRSPLTPSSRRRFLSSSLLTGIGLTAACAKRNSSQPAQGRTGAPGQPSKPHYGGQLSLRLPNDIDDFDVTYSGQVSAIAEFSLAYNRLLGFKSGPDVKYQDALVGAELADQWEVPDAQTFIFHLRRGAKFASLPPVNGRELTSADVKFSYEYASRTGQFNGKNLPRGQYKWMLEGLGSVETADPYTATVRFQKPFVPFLDYVCHPDLSILPHEMSLISGSICVGQSASVR